MSLTMHDVSLTYPDGGGRITALDDVSIRVEAGTVTAITGASGSGKSSLLAVGSTLLVPERGRVTIDEVDVTRLDTGQRAALRRSKIGIVFQQPNLLPALTARDQLRVMNELGDHKQSAAGAGKRADELLAAVGLAGQEHKRPGQLSGGQRQRVNIARAFMTEPSVLVVDEPTSALDQRNGDSIIQLILEMTRTWRTATMLVTHDLRHLHAMDAHYQMSDGVLTRVG